MSNLPINTSYVVSYVLYGTIEGYEFELFLNCKIPLAEVSNLFRL